MFAETYKIRPLAIILVGLFFASGAYANDPIAETPEHELFSTIQSLIKDSYCAGTQYTEARKQIQDALKSDMSDRQNFDESVSEKDTRRRIKIAEFSVKGCLKDGEDYFAAALIFQHGILPEHYLQAVSFTNKSLSLNYLPASALREVAIDRYLMSLGRSQIFGSQITAPAAYKQVETDLDLEPCLWPVDKTVIIPTAYRQEKPEYRPDTQAQIDLNMPAIPECDFPSKSAEGLLEALLRLEL